MRGRDHNGEPIIFRNHYKCPECGAEWTDEYSCMVDDECGACGTGDISPTHSENI